MSVLMSVEQADFSYLKEKTEATAGNLSVQINKLSDAEYIVVEKRFHKNYPQTRCKVTDKGRNAFEAYVKSLKKYLDL